LGRGRRGKKELVPRDLERGPRRGGSRERRKGCGRSGLIEAQITGLDDLATLMREVDPVGVGCKGAPHKTSHLADRSELGDTKSLRDLDKGDGPKAAEVADVGFGAIEELMRGRRAA